MDIVETSVMVVEPGVLGSSLEADLILASLFFKLSELPTLSFSIFVLKINYKKVNLIKL